MVDEIVDVEMCLLIIGAGCPCDLRPQKNVRGGIVQETESFLLSEKRPKFFDLLDVKHSNMTLGLKSHPQDIRISNVSKTC